MTRWNVRNIQTTMVRPNPCWTVDLTQSYPSQVDESLTRNSYDVMSTLELLILVCTSKNSSEKDSVLGFRVYE